MKISLILQTSQCYEFCHEQARKYISQCSSNLQRLPRRNSITATNPTSVVLVGPLSLLTHVVPVVSGMHNSCRQVRYVRFDSVAELLLQ